MCHAWSAFVMKVCSVPYSSPQRMAGHHGAMNIWAQERVICYLEQLWEYQGCHLNTNKHMGESKIKRIPKINRGKQKKNATQYKLAGGHVSKKIKNKIVLKGWFHGLKVSGRGDPGWWHRVTISSSLNLVSSPCALQGKIKARVEEHYSKNAFVFHM